MTENNMSDIKIDNVDLTDDLVTNYKKFIESVYRDMLLRPADKKGLEWYLSLLINEKASEDDIIRMISESPEFKNIQNFSHYSDQYWNELEEVSRYLNRLATDDPNTKWIQDLKNRFEDYLPFKKVLIVGCGNGWVERQLSDLGIGINFDAFDISETYLETARKEKGNRSINYFVADINDLEWLEKGKYDAVVNYAVLHHATEIESALKNLARTLKSNGLIFNWEYVGPAQNQYSDEHVEIMENIMNKLPNRLRSKYPLRPPLENFRVEPTEAIHSDLIKPMFRKYFNTIYERDLNGGIAYQILWNNITEFKDQSDKEAKIALKFLLDMDFLLTSEHKVPVLFWYGVGKSKIT